jgi:hypothetical protein
LKGKLSLRLSYSAKKCSIVLLEIPGLANFGVAHRIKCMRICKTSDWLGTLPSVISLCIMQPLLACHFEHLINGVFRKYEDITGFHNMDRDLMPYEENKQMATFCFLRYRLVGSKKNFRIQNPGTFRPSHFCFVSSSKRMTAQFA